MGPGPPQRPHPGGDAVRERRFVWVSGTGELSRRYPQSALILPYDFRLAAAPLLSAGVCHGTILLFWPASHDEHLPGEERERIEELAAEMAGVLHRAAGAGEPLRPLSATRVLPGPGGAPTPAAAPLPWPWPVSSNAFPRGAAPSGSTHASPTSAAGRPSFWTAAWRN